MLAGLLLACGGQNPAAKSPDGKTGAADSPVEPEEGPILSAAGENSGLEGAAKDSYTKGFEAWTRGDLRAAREAFAKAAGQAPKNASPEYALGIVQERLGDTTAAESAFRAAYGKEPKAERAIAAHALSLAARGKYTDARTVLDTQRAKLPESARLTVALAEVKSLEGDHAGAQKLAQDALRINPDFKEAMVAVARDHYRAERFELARYALASVIDGFGESTPPRDKNNADANLLRGLMEREIGRRQVAFEAFETAAKRRPDLVEAQVQVGSMKLEAGNATEALPHLELAVAYGPKNAYAHLNLGDAYRLLGRVEDAKRELELALALDSSLAVGHYDLGLLYLFGARFPGLTPEKQVQAAIDSLEKYKTKRAKNSKDDVDELIARAKIKQAELKAPAAPPAQESKP